MGRTGIRISFLASLLMAGAGCGSVKDSGAVDAAPGDGGIDADESGNITVSTKAAHFGQVITATVSDVDMISNLPNGTVLATGKSDAGGAASIKVVPNGWLTAAYRRPTDMGWEIVSFLGVKPGETLEFGNRNPIQFCAPAPAVCNPVTGSVQYNWTVQGGATQTTVIAQCGTQQLAAPTATVSFNEQLSCSHNPIDAAFISNTGTAVTGCTTRQNVVPPGPVTAGTPSQAPFNVIANITGIPADVTTVTTQFSPVLNTQFERSVTFAATGFSRSTGVNSGGAFTGNFQYCNLGKRTSATLTMSRPGFLSTRVIDSLPPNATSWTVSNPILPTPLENGGILSSVSQRRVEWTFGPDAGTAQDAVIAQFAWGVTVAGVDSVVIWSVILPPGSTEVVLPKLPASFDPFMPSPDTGLGFQFIRSIEIPTVTNYDEYRALGAQSGMCPECAARAGDIQRVMLSGF